MYQYLLFIIKETELTALVVSKGEINKVELKQKYQYENWNFLNYKNQIFKDFQLNNKWYDEFYIIFNSPEYTSLIIDLPFNDPKILNETIDLQVSDNIPFDASDFAISYKLIDEVDNNFTYHIGLMPKELIINAINLTKGSKSSVDLITNISSLLIGNDINDAILIYKDEINYGLVIREGKSIDDFCFTGDIENSNEIKIRSQKYHISASQVDFNGSFEDLVPNLLNKELKDYLVNFRVKEFAVNKFINNSITILKDLSFPIIILFFGLALYGFLNYFNITRSISTYEKTIKSTIKQFDDLSAENVKSASDIEIVNNRLKDELSSLSTNKIGVLEHLVTVTDTIEKAGGSKDYTVNNLSITNQKIVIEGNTTSYANLEKLERNFNRLSNIFCKITKNPSGGGQKINFTFTLDLICQDLTY